MNRRRRAAANATATATRGMPAAIATLLAVVLLAGAGCRGKHEIRSAVERDQVRPATEWLRMEPVKMLYDYVRIDTTSEGPGERPGAQYLKDFFDCAGIEAEIVCPQPLRCNLLARLPGRRREGSLLLLSHIDVARSFAKLWATPPFGGKIERGYLYGRGSYDTKSLTLVHALAMRDLKRAGIVPETDILLLAEADEEVGQRWGSRWLLEHRPEWFAGVSAVLNEGGTTEVLIRDVRLWGLETLQAGYGQLELGSRDPEALKALKDRVPKPAEPPAIPDPQVVESFNLTANLVANPLTDPLRHLDRVRNDPKELAELPDRYGAFLEPRSFFSPPYAFPPGQTERYRSYVIVSVPPGVPPERYLDRIVKAAAELKIDVIDRVSSGPTTASPYPTDFTRLLERVTAARYPGVPFGPSPGSGGMTTTVYFRQKGIPAYGYSPIAFNITDTSRRHNNDERIFLRDYVEGVELMSEVLKEFAFYPGNKTSRANGEK